MCVHKVYINYKRCTWVYVRCMRVCRKKIAFFERVWSINFVQKINIFHVFILGKIGKKRKCVDYILDRKKALLGKKNKILKSRKNCVFPKGLVYGFRQKLKIFPSFFIKK